jgi:nucleotide-binding universal stress UspA family protein
VFRDILVPLDLSDRNTRILEAALALAEPGQGRVTLLHVVQRVAGLPEGELRDFYQRLTGTAVRKLARAAAPFIRRRLRVREEVQLGRPATVIVRTAATRKVDVIVMGSHRVTPGGGGRGWGTTSYEVGLLAPCPVLLVK